nr:hypothetical protein CFP56_09467 [Quercus suber]
MARDISLPVFAKSVEEPPRTGGMLQSHRSAARKSAVTFLTLFTLYWTFYGVPIQRSNGRYEESSASSIPELASSVEAAARLNTEEVASFPSCKTAVGLDDIVVVIKTGATEAQEKLPVHFDTTLECFRHVVIFSDYEETMDGHIIYDALDNVTAHVRLNHDDFEMWRRLRDGGRTSLDPSELSTARATTDSSSLTGDSRNSAWRLDRFKNVPMLGKVLELKPDAKWYVFIDADTYLSWFSLLEWVQQLDHTKFIYTGSLATMAAWERAGKDWPKQDFCHGGSGYILSAPAVEAGARIYAEKQEEIDSMISDHWYGDVGLAQTMEEHLNLKVSSAFPMIQGGDPITMDFSEVRDDKKLWCFPAISYHHVAPSTIRELWAFEQNWTTRQAIGSGPLRHSDVFKYWLLPKLASANDGKVWVDSHANIGNVIDDVIDDIAGCRAICELDINCVQYSFSEGVCRTYDKLRLSAADGPRPNGSSGWVIEHIDSFVEDFDTCDGSENEGKWIEL